MFTKWICESGENEYRIMCWDWGHHRWGESGWQKWEEGRKAIQTHRHQPGWRSWDTDLELMVLVAKANTEAWVGYQISVFLKRKQMSPLGRQSVSWCVCVCVRVCTCVPVCALPFLISGFLSDLMHNVLKSSRLFLLTPLYICRESDGANPWQGREQDDKGHTSYRKLWNPWKPRWTLCPFSTGMWIRVAVGVDNYLWKCTKPLVLLVEVRLGYLREFSRWSCCMAVLGNWDSKPKFSCRRKLKGGEIRKTLRMSGFPKVLFHTEHWRNYLSGEFFCGRILIMPKGGKKTSVIFP